MASANSPTTKETPKTRSAQNVTLPSRFGTKFDFSSGNFLKKKSISEIKTNPGSDRAEAPPDQPHGRDALPLPPLLEVLQLPHWPQTTYQGVPPPYLLLILSFPPWHKYLKIPNGNPSNLLLPGFLKTHNFDLPRSLVNICSPRRQLRKVKLFKHIFMTSKFWFLPSSHLLICSYPHPLINPSPIPSSPHLISPDGDRHHG